MKLPDSIKKYMFVRSRSLSVFGASYRTDWIVVVVIFVVVFIALCGFAGVSYYWISSSVFPEDLVPEKVDTTVYTSDKKLIVQTQSYLQTKTQQFDAAR